MISVKVKSAYQLKPHTPETFEKCPVRGQFYSYELYLQWSGEVLGALRGIEDMLKRHKTEMKKDCARFE